MSIPFHPLANLFPLIEGEEFDELVASVREHGLREEITLFEDKILDGRNRYRACEASGVAPRFEQFTENDLYSFVIDKNIHRRHLNPSQRGMIAAKMATLKRGDNQHTKEHVENSTSSPVPTVNRMADLMNVNRATVIRARAVLNEGTDEEVKAVEEGRASVHTIAAQIRANIPKEERQGKRAEASHGRVHQLRANAQLWAHLRDALEHLSALPNPSAVEAFPMLDI